MKLHFLGTGGGRYATAKQKRKTGGTLIQTPQRKIIVDPGPGAINLLNEKVDNLEDLDTVIVSHSHLDHYNDAEAVIELITEILQNNCHLFANETVLKGFNEMERSVKLYHQNQCGRVEVLEEDSTFKLDDLQISSQELFHTDPKTVGFIIENNEDSIGFWIDTEYSDELTKFYKRCNKLVINCSRPKEKSYKGHTSVSDVPDILEQTGPDTCLLTHFSDLFLNYNLDEQEEWLKEKTDVKVVFAEDDMVFPGNRKITSF